MALPDQTAWHKNLPGVLLIGAGVVGNAIAEAHLVRGVSFVLADQDEASVEAAALRWSHEGWRMQRIESPIEGLFAMSAECLAGLDAAGGGGNQGDDVTVPSALLVIESIAEDLLAKQSLFNLVQASLGQTPVLCSNTSTFTINQIAAGISRYPQQVCGLHFFMPVQSRAAVEVIAGAGSDEAVVESIKQHAKRIGKHVLSVGDSPGFVVNRMLSVYLNQALCLLSGGATADQIERAAIAFGMPLSPFELIDWIGTPTMYHSGKAFLKAFPGRLDPSPIIPAMIKRKRLGRTARKGMYDYTAAPAPMGSRLELRGADTSHLGFVRSETLANETVQIAETYRTGDISLSDSDVLQLLTIPMWIEAKRLIDERIAESMDLIDTAMAGGLGYNSHTRWSGFYDELGGERIGQSMSRFGERYKSMRAT